MPSGGHKARQDFVLKERSTVPEFTTSANSDTFITLNVSEINTNVELVNVTNTNGQLHDINTTSVTIAGNMSSDGTDDVLLCQVSECVSTACYRCIVLNCPFNAICDLHGVEHNKHAFQIHVKDNQVSNKRIRT